MVYRGSEIVLTVALRSAAVDIEAKWLLNRESVLCVRVSFEKICDHCSTGFFWGGGGIKFLYV